MTARVSSGWVKGLSGCLADRFGGADPSRPERRGIRAWYAEAMANQWEHELRAGHPEHFINHPRPQMPSKSSRTSVRRRCPGTSSIAAFRTTLLIPHHGTTSMPSTSAPRFWIATAFASLLDAGAARRRRRDAHEAYEPSSGRGANGLLRRHLTHFSIEYRNWRGSLKPRACNHPVPMQLNPVT